MRRRINGPMLAFQHQDEITARLFFFPKLFRIYQLSRPKIIFKQESSDFNFSTDPCTAQLILFPNAHGRTSLLSYPWRQMGLQTQNAIRIMVTSRRQKMAPINTRLCPCSTAFTRLYSAGSQGWGSGPSAAPAGGDTATTIPNSASSPASSGSLQCLFL